MRYVKAEERIAIPLGRQGENLVETVRFHVDGWSDLFGVGAFELLHKRVNDPAPYPCPITLTDDGKIVEWVVRNSDVAQVGRGMAEFVYIVNGAMAKSVLYATSTLQAIDGGGDVPEPYQDWVDDVLNAATNAASEAAAQTTASIQQTERAIEAAEALRAQAEQGRVSAENTRVDNESARGRAETTRGENESGRVSAEESRVRAENERVAEFNQMINSAITNAQIDALWP